MKTRIISCIALSLLVLFIGCNSSNQNNESLKVELSDTITYPVADSTILKYLQSPSEIMMLISDIEPKTGLTNPTHNIDKYIDVRSKSINMGVYLADIAYLGYQGGKNNIDEYIDIYTQLSTDLRISTLFTKSDIAEKKHMLNDPDSVYVLTQLFYDKLITTLNDEKRHNILALISMGAFIESMHLIVANYQNVDDIKQLSTELLNFKVLFEEYYSYALQFKNDPKVSKVIKLIDPLFSQFNNLEISEKENSVKYVKDNKIIISGGKSLKINQEEYEDLKETIESIRTQIITNYYRK